MRPLTVLLLLLLWQPFASANASVTYKCWCTLRGGAEKEYTIPNANGSDVRIPIEVPDFGRLICSIGDHEGQEKTGSQSGYGPYLGVELSTVQPLQPARDGSYQTITIMDASFASVYGKRINVLETPAYTLSVELIKN